MFYPGIDAAKAKLDCCLLLNEAGIAALLEWTAKQDVPASELKLSQNKLG